MIPMNPL